MARASASMVAGLSLASSVPGTTGTPAARISAFARALSPSAAIVAGDGPMNAMPVASTLAANSLFSERKP